MSCSFNFTDLREAFHFLVDVAKAKQYQQLGFIL